MYKLAHQKLKNVQLPSFNSTTRGIDMSPFAREFSNHYYFQANAFSIWVKSILITLNDLG